MAARRQDGAPGSVRAVNAAPGSLTLSTRLRKKILPEASRKSGHSIATNFAKIGSARSASGHRRRGTGGCHNCGALIAAKMTVLNVRTLGSLPQVSTNNTRGWDTMGDDIASTFGLQPAFLPASLGGLVLSATRGPFHLVSAVIKELGRGNMYPWFCSALLIHLGVPKCPIDLQFKPLGAHGREVRAKLKSIGSSVD